MPAVETQDTKRYTDFKVAELRAEMQLAFAELKVEAETERLRRVKRWAFGVGVVMWSATIGILIFAFIRL